MHQERGLAYVLFTGAGHLVPQWRPAQALVFLREFVLGDNRTGTLEADGQTVVGGEDPALAGAFMPGGLEIYYGSATTAGTSTVPSATAAEWEAFIQTATEGRQVSATVGGSAATSVVTATSRIPESMSHSSGTSTMPTSRSGGAPKVCVYSALQLAAIACGSAYALLL